jgi:ABC-type multidrug transport system fused ATPase/permease subunit
MGKYNLKAKEERVALVPGAPPPPGSAASSSSPPPSSLRTILDLTRADGNWRLMLLGVVSMLVSTATGLAQPALFGRILDALAAADAPLLNSLLVALVAVTVAEALASFLKGYSFSLVGERVVARLRTRVFSALLSMEVAFFDGSRTGELVSRLTGDVTVLRDAATYHAVTGLKGATVAVGGLVYLFSVSWRLASLILLLVPGLAVAARLYGRYAKRLGREVRQALAEASTVAEETMSSIRTVRSFAAEGRQEAHFAAKVDATLRLGMRAAVASGAFSGGSEGLTALAFAAMLAYGGSLVLAGELTTGELTSFLLYSVRIGSAMGSLAGVYGSLQTSMGATDRVFELLRRIPWVPLADGQRLQGVRGDIAFEDVSFAYPARPDAPVLTRLSLSIPAGTVAALVGPSGAGKSTVISLVERFYDPDAGRVTVDGVDLRGVDGSSLRRCIGLVQQEPTLFALSIRDNIAFGRPDATEEEIERAARNAHAHDFIAALPEGYMTFVGERGIRLSGGQKQRVAIARALLQDPKILLLDEATSALDSESEHLVKEALQRLMVGRTTVIVAHRLSTVRRADVVFVLAKGAVAAAGSHDELMGTSPLYARLVQRQLLAAEEMRGEWKGGGGGLDGGGEYGDGDGDDDDLAGEGEERQRAHALVEIGAGGGAERGRPPGRGPEGGRKLPLSTVQTEATAAVEEDGVTIDVEDEVESAALLGGDRV